MKKNKKGDSKKTQARRTRWLQSLRILTPFLTHKKKKILNEVAGASQGTDEFALLVERVAERKSA